MHLKLAVATAAALVVLGTGGAAYAVVAEGSANPATTANVLPIDDNHSRLVPVATTTDDRGHAPEPGDDRGGVAEPGDDHGGATTATTATTARAGHPAARADDHGRLPEPGDDRGGLAAPAAAAPAGAAAPVDDRGRGRGSDDGSRHH